MPTLNWIGKEAVVEHHRRVPTRLLECDRELSFGDPDAENLLVEGEADEGSSEGDEQDEEAAGLQVMPSVIHKQAQVAVRFLRKLFDGKQVFENPKDHEVIARLISYVSGPKDIVLDSFAGSGTTGHAVVTLNARDGGRRRSILVEIDANIAREITRERLARVCGGYTDAGGEHVAGLGSGFRYCRWAKTLLDEEGNINGDVPFADLARYVYLLETGVPAPKRPNKNCPLLGVHRGRAVYLLYNGVLGDKRPASGNVLTSRVLAALPPHPDGDAPRAIYGEACRLSEATLARENVTFRQIPYSLREG